MIVKDLLHKTRHTLSDLTANRWSDERLLILLNEGLNDIAKNTILFVKTGYISLASQQTEYDLSSFATKILRIEYLDEPLAYFSHSEMDKKDSASGGRLNNSCNVVAETSECLISAAETETVFFSLFLRSRVISTILPSS